MRREGGWALSEELVKPSRSRRHVLERNCAGHPASRVSAIASITAFPSFTGVSPRAAAALDSPAPPLLQPTPLRYSARRTEYAGPSTLTMAMRILFNAMVLHGPRSGV